ncbi:hypothetical protein [Campylobacter curvus]|jgi:uncharacterized protein YcfL|uniref:hypothetical protein n=1 Tax=Campylobacter curvus TaxID=200 RepID=UPI00146FD3DA|nr:hypothetical protein [Campylobacter curvus]
MFYFLRYLIILSFISLFLVGCSSKLPEISSEEAFKNEQVYLQEAQSAIKQIEQDSQKIIFKFIQPNNKKEQCKILTSTRSDNDHTIQENYKLYWDGECKDGFAYGLGREIELTMISHLELIGYYKKGKPIDYCFIYNKTDNSQIAGTCAYSVNQTEYTTTRLLKNTDNDIDIAYVSRAFNIKKPPMLEIFYSPLQTDIIYSKIYPNFIYRVRDAKNNKLDIATYTFDIAKDRNTPASGFVFALLKNGQPLGAEFANGILTRYVSLPQQYIDKTISILSDIQTIIPKITDAQTKAVTIKENYKKKLCKDHTPITFMDDNEYREICKENQLEQQIATKINVKIAKISKEIEARYQQIQQQQTTQQEQQLSGGFWEGFNKMFGQMNSTIQQANQNSAIITQQVSQQNQEMMNYNQRQQTNQILQRIEQNLNQIVNPYGPGYFQP